MTTAMLAAAIVATCGSTAVLAQEQARGEINDRLRACGALSGMTEQLQCFNAIVDSLGPSSAATEVASTVAAVAKTPIASATASTATASTASATAASKQTAVATVSATVSATVATATGEESTTVNVSAPAAVNTAEVVTTPATAEDSFGLETVQAKTAPKKEEQKKAEIQSIRATIVSAWVTADKRFEARLDNGQVWRETARTRRNRLPKEGSTVVISKGAFGSYKMKFGNDNRLAAVRRTQ